MPRLSRYLLPCLAALPLACAGDPSTEDADAFGDEVGPTDSDTDEATDSDSEASSESSESSDSTDSTDSESSSSESTDSTDSTDSETGEAGCQTEPELCPEGTVCDVITGDCLPIDDPCVLSGPSTPCEGVSCGPGTACDDQGSCIPVAPCAEVVCSGPDCWGATCLCERPEPCTTATAEQLNGPFSVEMMDLEFGDDCTAWMVTLRSGTDYLRRITPDGTVTQWDGVSNLDMGEVSVLRTLNINPQSAPLLGDVAAPGASLPSTHGEDAEVEVALTYICTGGCFGADPQGVARLIEGDPVPLPLVLPAVPTNGTGPFGFPVADGGPMGLTWGEDLRLYVGNANQNGDYDTVNLMDAQTQLLTTFPTRVTASAPLTSVHLLLALDTGEVLRFNTALNQATPLVDLGVGVTSLNHDAFTGEVYASLSDLSIVVIQPFTGEVTPFGTMPALGRLAISPEGQLWYAPAKYLIGDEPLVSWELPSTL